MSTDVPDDIASWLLGKDWPGLVILLMGIVIAILYRDNIRLRQKIDDIREKQIKAQEETLQELSGAMREQSQAIMKRSRSKT